VRGKRKLAPKIAETVIADFASGRSLFWVNFWGGFYHFWDNFTHFVRFLPTLGDFYHFWAKN
jgi:hypothetical protein